MNRSSILARVLGATLLVSGAAHGATLVVDTAIDAVDALPGDGACATASAQCTLRAAVQEANALAGADTIALPAGTYALAIAGRNENAAASGDLDVGTDLVLQGAGPAATIIDASALDRVLDIDAGATPAMTVAIAGLTIRGGLLDTAVGDGPGIGAGLRVRGDVTVTMTDVDVRDNRTDRFGGGAGIDSRGCLVGTRVRVIGNGQDGALNDLNPLAGGFALANNAAMTACLVLDDSEISDNHADGAGAIFAQEAVPVTLRRSLVAHNTGRFAGGLMINQQNAFLLENVTLSGNLGLAGAAFVDGFGSLTLRHCTVTGNAGLPGLGAVVGAIQDVHGGFGRTMLANTIVAGNGPGSSADDLDRATSAGGGNLIGTTRGLLFSPLASDQLGVDAQLAALADNGGPTRSHLPGAAAIDHGVDGACLPTDQRGGARPRDGDGDGVATCDVGAIEREPPALFADGFE